MVDSGTIQFIASQEMARKQGQGALLPGGLINSNTPGWTGGHPMHAVLEWEGWVGCRAMPAWPQARQGTAAGNFLWKAWYRTTLIPSTPLKLTGLERMQAKQSWPPFQRCIRGRKHVRFNVEGRSGS